MHTSWTVVIMPGPISGTLTLRLFINPCSFIFSRRLRLDANVFASARDDPGDDDKSADVVDDDDEDIDGVCDVDFGPRILSALIILLPYIDDCGGPDLGKS